MRELTPLLVIIIAPFILGALVLVFIQRKRGPDGPRDLRFLVDHHGFAEPQTFFVSRELHHRYVGGDDAIDVSSEGDSPPLITLSIRGAAARTTRLSLPAFADLIRANPAILRGELDALRSADSSV